MGGRRKLEREILVEALTSVRRWVVGGGWCPEQSYFVLPYSSSSIHWREVSLVERNWWRSDGELACQTAVLRHDIYIVDEVCIYSMWLGS